MLEYLTIGGGFAFAAAIQPGPLQAFLITRVAASGWRRTLPACLAPVISDLPIALLVLVVLGQLPLLAQHLLRVAGGILLIYLAVVTVRQLRRPGDPAAASSAPRNLRDAVLVNLLNPNPYLGWALVLGPATLAAWRERPAYGVALVGSFYGTMVVTLALIIVLVGTVSRFGPQAQRRLAMASAVALAGLGLYLLIAAMRSIMIS